jgi:hypothetical protein
MYVGVLVSEVVPVELPSSGTSFGTPDSPLSGLSSPLGTTSSIFLAGPMKAPGAVGLI